MRKAILLCAILALSGCASFSEAPMEAKIASACRGYAVTLMSLAEFKGELSDEQIEVVNAVRPTAREICQKTDENRTVEALAEITAIVSRLKGIEREVK